ncbi:tetratricopeptide repeat protein [Ancylostoma duodenale]|uniref:Tetratricopeptide repeat protein n=1 Tax=Ancylostoma duodenale TaxID=51022 RepID=A0A0C2DBX1_9BILA|nr:tetratricopeptide repeat protein [Ancylostoma duodenale]
MPESTIEEKLKVKLNAKAGSTVVVLKENILLISHQERDLRVWDLETEENGIISLQSAKGFDGEDGILCMDYSKRKGMISAGTLKGKVANWKHRSGESTVENSWRLQNGNQVGEKITSIEWCPMYSALAVNTGAELTILQEENNIIAAIQSGPSSFTLVNVVSSVSQELKLNFEVKGIHVQEKQLVVWSVDTVMTFDVQSSLATIQSSTFSCRAEDIVIHQQTLYCMEGDKINVRTLQTPTKCGDRLLVWDAEADLIAYFSFTLGMTDQQQYEAEAELASSQGRPITAAARKMEREQTRFRLPLHEPGFIFWDETDDRFLVCHAQASSQHMMEFDEEEVRGEKSIGRFLIARSLREFSGVENCDEATRKGMMDFCYYLSIGQMDEAFKAIRFIKSESVWEHMASMSVKTRRLDVAAVCLGNMKNIRGARALRKAQEAGESEAIQCAVLAVELGMLDDAEAMYMNAGRYDMVNKIHQAQNSWNQAFEVASRYDRIHLRNTHYNYAKYLERAGALEPAIEKSLCEEEEGTVNFSKILRQLFVVDMQSLNLRELHAWWARYLESIGELDGAMMFYNAAKDNLSQVRIKCTQGKLEEASHLALESKDRAACYHLARIYEAEGNFSKAVDFYTKAHAYNSAIRLVKEHDMRDLLANLCLMAGGSEIVEAARYFEDIPGYTHQAVMLYHKAGMVGRALDLAFRAEQFSALDLVTKDLHAGCDPNVLKRAAEFFSNNQNYEKAVELLCLAKDAMRALLKSGDTQKIVFFANTARNKDIYILAANYLQMEVETFNDFSKAADALEHAQRTVERGLQEQSASSEKSNSTISALTALKEEINEHLSQLAKFEKIKEVYAVDENDAVLQLQNLVENATEDSIIRPSHIYSLLIAHYAGKQNYRPAYRCITQLQKLQKNIDLSTIVDPELLDKICDELGVPRVTVRENEEADSDNEVQGVEYSHAMKKREALF